MDEFIAFQGLLRHEQGQPQAGQGGYAHILSAEDFTTAYDEITAWGGLSAHTALPAKRYRRKDKCRCHLLQG